VFAILRSCRFMFRISVSRMILLFSRRARSYDDERSCGTYQIFLRVETGVTTQRKDHPRVRWCGRRPGADVAVSRIAYLAFRTGKMIRREGVSVEASDAMVEEGLGLG